MPIRLSRRVRALRPSLTFRLARKAQELRSAGVDVVSLGLGEPDFDTPEAARSAAHEAIDAGRTHYTANEGIRELREAVARSFERRTGRRYDPATEVLCTAGAKQALAHAVLALVDEGDEVLVPSPYWLTYPEQVRLAGGRPIFVETDPDSGYLLEPEAVERAVTERTRLLLLNSPNNPTGAVLDRARLAALAEIALRHDLVVVSDEIYAPLVYGGTEAPSLVDAAPHLRDRAVICSGLSKGCAMTGWRIGYALAPAEILSALARIQGHTTSHPSSISQYAALAALEGTDADTERMRAVFETRRALVLSLLERLPGVRAPRPDGAFYVFLDVRPHLGRRTRAGRTLEDCASFCEALLDEARLSLVPGAAFGAPGRVRLSYAASEEALRDGIERLVGFVSRLEDR